MKKKNKTSNATRNSSGIYRQVSLLYFLVLLGMIYTANALGIEGKKRQITELKKTLKEERWRYESAKSEYMYYATKSEVDSRVAELGLVDDASSIYILREE